MSSVVISGNTSGTITLDAPAVAGTTVLTLPATSGTVALTASPTFTGQATIPTINLTGGQITFPATAVPSADANTLDDYEEGTWTPAFSGAAGTVTYGQQKGVYTKIGDTVFVSGFLQSNSTSGATGSQVFITGLPFTPTTINGQNGYSVLMSRKNGWSSAPVGGMTLSGQTQFEIYDLAANNNTLDSVGTDIASGSATSLWFSLYYKV
jgi:hypothetical protein